MLMKKVTKIIILSIIFICFFLIINEHEYQKYLTITNNKIATIINNLKQQYPVDDNEIISILNNQNSDTTFFKKYALQPNEPYIYQIKLNYQNYLNKYLIFFTIIFLTILLIVIYHHFKNKKEINKIINFLNQINNQNYSLDLNDYKEGELAILKQEIYKILIKQKEATINNQKDKIYLKNALENISHQLKTPLTEMLINIDNLQNNQIPKKTKMNFIIELKREVLNMDYLVTTLLKIAKFASKTIVFKQEKIEVSKIINEALKNTACLSDLKNITINVNQKNKAYLYCDYKWQVEAITNILKNSIQNSYQNGIINITYEQKKIYTEIIIEDYGQGILKEDIPHIFERYYSKNNTGIGLNLAKMIIKENNGHISVSSNKTTTFTIKYMIQ